MFRRLFFRTCVISVVFAGCDFLVEGISAATDPPGLAQRYYETNKGDTLPSVCTGTEADGKLEHGKLFPYTGPNYRYFDLESYLWGHAYMSDKMLSTLLASYREMEQLAPGRIFTCMESGLQNGGPIPGHRTHQNGRSVDLMVPLVKDTGAGAHPYYTLDSIGGMHYGLDFDDRGRYTADSTIAIDFNLLAQQVLSLDRQARKNGLHVKKVILKLELKDDFYRTTYGKEVKRKGIYLAMNLPANVNKQHDDHIHVDFDVVP